MLRRVNPGFDSDDTDGLPLFAGIGGCDATVPAVAKLKVGARPLTVDEARAITNQTLAYCVRCAPFSNLTTSRDAAEEIKPRLGDLEELVLEAVRTSLDGLCCDEIEQFTSLSHQCASARCRGLVLKGKLKDSGRTRKTRSGRTAIVWVTT